MDANVLSENNKTTTRRAVLGAVVAAAVASGTVKGASSKVALARVNPRIMYQKFEGWGTSLAWWGHVIGGFAPEIRRNYLTKVFDSKFGLGLTVARYNIGGGENPHDHFLSYRAAIPGYAPHPGHFDWQADHRQRLVLRECMAMGVSQIQAFSNSPPYDMTISGSVTGAKNGGNNLKPSDFQAFADYLADVVDHFDRKWGIRFQTLEPFNEPASFWWKYGGKQEGCHISNRGQNIIIPMLATALRKRQLPTRVAAPDDNSIDETLTSFDSYSPRARQDVYQIDTHSYHGQKRIALRQTAEKYRKRLWMSEYGDGDPSGLTMAGRIIEDMRELRPLAWVYWQAIDGGGGWGFLSNVENGRQTRYVINKKYYVMANFSRFIRPGFRFMDISDANGIAAINEVERRLVIVAVNQTAAVRPMIFDLTGFGIIGGHVQAYVTSPAFNLKYIPGPSLDGNRFRVALPAHSTTTFAINDCRMR